MYRLTPRMLQRFRRDLEKYHALFDGGRCAGWEQEELIVAAIKSDTQAQHHVFWREAGHDDEADIVIRTNGTKHALQIKSGSVKNGYLTLSGHRLGRFDGVMEDITGYLNASRANILAVPYKKLDNENGRQHIYQVSYVDVRNLARLESEGWEKVNKHYIQINRHGVESSVRPSMSWQIWWKIPMSCVKQEEPIVIG